MDSPMPEGGTGGKARGPETAHASPIAPGASKLNLAPLGHPTGKHLKENFTQDPLNPVSRAPAPSDVSGITPQKKPIIRTIPVEKYLRRRIADRNIPASGKSSSGWTQGPTRQNVVELLNSILRKRTGGRDPEAGDLAKEIAFSILHQLGLNIPTLTEDTRQTKSGPTGILRKGGSRQEGSTTRRPNTAETRGLNPHLNTNPALLSDSHNKDFAAAGVLGSKRFKFSSAFFQRVARGNPSFVESISKEKLSIVVSNLRADGGKEASSSQTSRVITEAPAPASTVTKQRSAVSGKPLFGSDTLASQSGENDELQGMCQVEDLVSTSSGSPTPSGVGNSVAGLSPLGATLSVAEINRLREKHLQKRAIEKQRKRQLKKLRSRQQHGNSKPAQANVQEEGAPAGNLVSQANESSKEKRAADTTNGRNDTASQKVDQQEPHASKQLNAAEKTADGGKSKPSGEGGVLSEIDKILVQVRDEPQGVKSAEDLSNRLLELALQLRNEPRDSSAPNTDTSQDALVASKQDFASSANASVATVQTEGSTEIADKATASPSVTVLSAANAVSHSIEQTDKGARQLSLGISAENPMSLSYPSASGQLSITTQAGAADSTLINSQFTLPGSMVPGHPPLGLSEVETAAAIGGPMAFIGQIPPATGVTPASHSQGVLVDPSDNLLRPRFKDAPQGYLEVPLGSTVPGAVPPYQATLPEVKPSDIVVDFTRNTGTPTLDDTYNSNVENAIRASWEESYLKLNPLGRLSKSVVEPSSSVGVAFRQINGNQYSARLAPPGLFSGLVSSSPIELLDLNEEKTPSKGFAVSETGKLSQPPPDPSSIPPPSSDLTAPPPPLPVAPAPAKYPRDSEGNPVPAFYVFDPQGHCECAAIEEYLREIGGVPFDLHHVTDVLSKQVSPNEADNENQYLPVTASVLNKSLPEGHLWIVIRSNSFLIFFRNATVNFRFQSYVFVCCHFFDWRVVHRSTDRNLLPSLPYFALLKCCGPRVQFVCTDTLSDVKTGHYSNIMSGEHGIVLPVSADVLINSFSELDHCPFRRTVITFLWKKRLKNLKRSFRRLLTGVHFFFWTLMLSRSQIFNIKAVSGRSWQCLGSVEAILSKRNVLQKCSPI